MESEPMLTPRKKSPQPEKLSPEEGGTGNAALCRTGSPTHYQRTIPAPDILFGIRHAYISAGCSLSLCFLCQSYVGAESVLYWVHQALWVFQVQGSHFPAVSRISAKMKFQNPRKKIRPNLFLKRRLKLTQTASKLQPRADDRILRLVFALRYEISRNQPVAFVFWVKMLRSDFVRRHEAALCKEIDKDCKNKWSWTWLDKKVEGMTLDTCFHKLKKAIVYRIITFTEEISSFCW